MEFIAFMAAILHTEYDYLENIIQEYDIGGYLIAAEISDDSHKDTYGQHFHFLVQMNDVDYHKFSKRVFIDRYKLRGKAIKDKPRQYGRVKKIHDLERMGAYTLKDGNIRSNMTEQQLQSFKDIAFKVNEKEDFRDKIMDYIKEKVNKISEYNQETLVVDKRTKIKIVDDYLIISYIIDYYKSLPDKLPVSKAQIESHFKYYQMYHSKISSYELAQKWFPFT